MSEQAISPMLAISTFVDDDLPAHAEMVNDAFRKINLKLPKGICNGQGENIGVERPVFVLLPGITQAALIEVALSYRAKGWKVDYGIDFTETRHPMVTITVPSRG